MQNCKKSHHLWKYLPCHGTMGRYVHRNLLDIHNDLTIHQTNLQVLMTESYKIVNDVAPPILNSLFEVWNFQLLSTDFRRTVNYGIETLTSRALSLWAKILPEYKLAASFKEFKLKIKKLKCDTYACRLCKKFQPNLQFMNFRNMVSKNVNLLCFTAKFFKNLEISTTTPPQHPHISPSVSSRGSSI